MHDTCVSGCFAKFALLTCRHARTWRVKSTGACYAARLGCDWLVKSNRTRRTLLLRGSRIGERARFAVNARSHVFAGCMLVCPRRASCTTFAPSTRLIRPLATSHAAHATGVRLIPTAVTRCAVGCRPTLVRVRASRTGDACGLTRAWLVLTSFTKYTVRWTRGCSMWID